MILPLMPLGVDHANIIPTFPIRLGCDFTFDAVRR